MISPESILYAENVPQELIHLKDHPWYFIGEVQPQGSQSLLTICTCQTRITFFEQPEVERLYTFERLELQAYQFVTDDLIELTLYIGQCVLCGKVHWARSGPPFRRLSAYVRSTK